MRRTHSIRRPAFTLIELLVVIGIIVLLSAVLLNAFTKARDMAKRTQTAGEIHELELAVESFKTTYDVKYIPSALVLSSSYAPPFPNPTTQDQINANLAMADSQQYLSKVWPKAGWSTGNPLPQGTLIPLDGNQVLVFLLGGVGPADSRFPAGWSGNRSGFLNSPTNPFSRSGNTVSSPADGSLAKGPFYNFKADRINGDSHYLDPYGWPYYYFSSKNGNDYGFFGRYKPLLNTQNDPFGFNDFGGYGGDQAKNAPPMNPFLGPDGKFLRSDSFQIVSAGKDSTPGSGGTYTPGIGAYSPGSHGGDDIANFHKGQLGGDE
jgi:prepilin-type N-terminal cleavage/methylation domain-containing protein